MGETPHVTIKRLLLSLVYEIQYASSSIKIVSKQPLLNYMNEITMISYAFLSNV